jgi:hypothetical protein
VGGGVRDQIAGLLADSMAEGSLADGVMPWRSFSAEALLTSPTTAASRIRAQSPSERTSLGAERRCHSPISLGFFITPALSSVGDDNRGLDGVGD